MNQPKFNKSPQSYKASDKKTLLKNFGDYCNKLANQPNVPSLPDNMYVKSTDHILVLIIEGNIDFRYFYLEKFFLTLTWHVTMDLLLLGSNTRLSCTLIKLNL